MKESKFLIEIEDHLQNNMLKFWVDYAFDYENNAIYPAVGCDNKPVENLRMGKSSILCTRVMWTFSKAYAIYKKEEYKRCAIISYNEFLNVFYDEKNQGVNWALNCTTNELDKRKHLYSQAFAIYGLAEYYAAFKDEKALKIALELYKVIETKCIDKELGGYFENFDENFNVIDKYVLAPQNIDCVKTMNAILHTMEAYTTLYNVTKLEEIKENIIKILDIIFEKIQNSSLNELQMFFTRDFKSVSNSNSPGHDIETSWLICETAKAINEKKYIEKANDFAFRIANHVLEIGFDELGTIKTKVGEINTTDLDKFSRIWWPHPEGMLGYYKLYKITGDMNYYKKCIDLWELSKKYYIDAENGEWCEHIMIDPEDPTKTTEFPYRSTKSSFWKCPYHSSRMCYELLKNE